MNDFFDLQARTPQGTDILMSELKGKTLLIVNTATKCGLAPQFRELEALHQKFNDLGLVIIGFPCNQFQNQEPESNETMEQNCEDNFGVTFQLPGKFGKRIKWNFTKFLITPEGTPFRRYTPTTKPSSMEEDIRGILPTI